MTTFVSVLVELRRQEPAVGVVWLLGIVVSVSNSGY